MAERIYIMLQSSPGREENNRESELLQSSSAENSVPMEQSLRVDPDFLVPVPIFFTSFVKFLIVFF